MPWPAAAAYPGRSRKDGLSIGPVPRNIVRCAAVVLALLSLSAARAAPLRADPCRERDPQTLDRWHEWTEEGLIAAVRRFDLFFGDDSLKDDVEHTWLRWTTGLRLHEREGASVISRLNLHLALPALERRLQVVVNEMLENDEPTRVSGYRDTAREATPEFALRLLQPLKDEVRVSASAGLRAGSPVQLLGRVRAVYSRPVACWEVRLSQGVRWLSQDGWRMVPEMRWSRPVNTRWMLRSSSRLTWEEATAGITPGQSFSLSHEVSAARAWRAEVSARWPEFPHTRTADYALEFGERRLIYRDWLYLHLVPGIHFPQEHRYASAVYGSILLEVVFGRDP